MLDDLLNAINASQPSEAILSDAAQAPREEATDDLTLVLIALCSFLSLSVLRMLINGENRTSPSATRIWRYRSTQNIREGTSSKDTQDGPEVTRKQW